MEMRSGRLTVILLGAAILLGAVVPPVREALMARVPLAAGLDSKGFPLPATYAAIAAAHPEDGELWLGYAEALSAGLGSGEEPGVEPPREEEIHEAFERAIELEPDSPGARLCYALFQIDMAKARRLPDEGVSDAPAALTAAQIKAVRRARETLQECRRLDPDNAAPDYLLAWTYLAERRNEEALETLREGMRKSEWSTYQAESARAVLKLVEQTELQTLYKPMTAMALSVTTSHTLGPVVRSLVRTLRNLGDQLREQGKHERAIECYEAIARAGHLMRVNARDIIDGLIAVALSHIAVSSEAWAPPDEEARLKADKALGKGELRAPGFAAYLREHGRADLAEFVLEDLKAARAWKAEVHVVIERLVPELVRDVSGGGVMHAAAVWAIGMALLGLAVAVGLLSLGGWYRREPSVRAQWSYRQWLGLLAVLLLPGQLVATAFTRVIWLREEITSPVWYNILLAGVGLGVVGWVVGTLVLSLRKRGQVPEEHRLGKGRSFLQGLRAIICPTLAALVLLAVIGAWVTERGLGRAADRHRQILVQGEARYYGLSEVPGPDHDASP